MAFDGLSVCVNGQSELSRDDPSYGERPYQTFSWLRSHHVSVGSLDRWGQVFFGLPDGSGGGGFLFFFVGFFMVL